MPMFWLSQSSVAKIITAELLKSHARFAAHPPMGYALREREQK